MYTFEYDTTFVPAMPVVEVHISMERGLEGRVVPAIVDSGADASMLPLQILKQIGARIAGRHWMVGVTGTRTKADLYPIFLQLGNHSLYVSVIGNPINTDTVIGRDVLNHMIITLNGLAETVELAPA